MRPFGSRQVRILLGTDLSCTGNVGSSRKLDPHKACKEVKDMMKSFGLIGGIVGVGIVLLLPELLFAAGEKASELVVVADTRRLSGVMKYFANLYNTNTLLFAVWAVVLTALWGAILGFLMDWIMVRTGLDLKSRKIVEH